jgi:hypothetical protein
MDQPTYKPFCHLRENGLAKNASTKFICTVIPNILLTEQLLLSPQTVCAAGKFILRNKSQEAF